MAKGQLTEKGLEVLIERTEEISYNKGYKQGVIDTMMQINGVSPKDLEMYAKAKKITDDIFKQAGML